MTAPDGQDLPTGRAPSRRRALWLALALVVLVAMAVGGALIYRTSGDDGGTAAQSGAPSTARTSSAATTSPSEPSVEPSSTSSPVVQPSGSGQASSPAPAGPAELAAVTTVAQKAVAAFNRRDAELMKSISCDPSVVQADQIPPGTQASLVSRPTVTGDTAQVTVQLILGGNTQAVPLPMKRTATGWCVD